MQPPSSASVASENQLYLLYWFFAAGTGTGTYTHSVHACFTGSLLQKQQRLEDELRVLQHTRTLTLLALLVLYCSGEREAAA